MFGSKECFVDLETPPLLGKSWLKVTYCSNEHIPVLNILTTTLIKLFFVLFNANLKIVAASVSRRCEIKRLHVYEFQNISKLISQSKIQTLYFHASLGDLEGGAGSAGPVSSCPRHDFQA